MGEIHYLYLIESYRVYVPLKSFTFKGDFPRLMTGVNHPKSPALPSPAALFSSWTKANMEFPCEQSSKSLRPSIILVGE